MKSQQKAVNCGSTGNPKRELSQELYQMLTSSRKKEYLITDRKGRKRKRIKWIKWKKLEKSFKSLGSRSNLYKTLMQGSRVRDHLELYRLLEHLEVDQFKFFKLYDQLTDSKFVPEMIFESFTKFPIELRMLVDFLNQGLLDRRMIEFFKKHNVEIKKIFTQYRELLEAILQAYRSGKLLDYTLDEVLNQLAILNLT